MTAVCAHADLSASPNPPTSTVDLCQNLPRLGRPPHLRIYLEMRVLETLMVVHVKLRPARRTQGNHSTFSFE
jgi:hypothetical protein